MNIPYSGRWRKFREASRTERAWSLSPGKIAPGVCRALSRRHGRAEHTWERRAPARRYSGNHCPPNRRAGARRSQVGRADGKGSSRVAHPCVRNAHRRVVAGSTSPREVPDTGGKPMVGNQSPRVHRPRGYPVGMESRQKAPMPGLPQKDRSPESVVLPASRKGGARLGAPSTSSAVFLQPLSPQSPSWCSAFPGGWSRWKGLVPCCPSPRPKCSPAGSRGIDEPAIEAGCAGRNRRLATRTRAFIDRAATRSAWNSDRKPPCPVFLRRTDRQSRPFSRHHGKAVRAWERRAPARRYSANRCPPNRRAGARRSQGRGACVSGFPRIWDQAPLRRSGLAPQTLSAGTAPGYSTDTARGPRALKRRVVISFEVRALGAPGKLPTSS